MFACRQKRAERSRVQAIGAFLDQLEEHPFTVATMSDPQKRHAHYDLERVVSSAETWRARPPHPAINDMLELFYRPASYHAEIDILSVTDVTATHNDLVGNLDALPETMRFCRPYVESFGPFDEDGMERLRQSVFAEFSPDSGSREGQFDIIDVTWSGKRIAGNSGASRRFSLWRRLSARSTGPVRIRGHIHPIELDMSALRAILTDWRILRVSRSSEIAISYHAMRAIWPDGIFALNYETSWEDRREEGWIIPLPHRVPLEMQRRFTDLHAQLGLNGIEDVLRGVCEAISLWRRSSVRSKPDIERPDTPALP